MDENASQSHMLKFVLDHGSGAISASRRGTLSIPGRHIVQTPHYVPATSRGIVPHIAQDLMEKRTSVLGVYMGLEDFIEKSSPHVKHPVIKSAAQNAIPILNAPESGEYGRLSTFSALPSKVFTILGPRRMPPVASPLSNTNTSISIHTSYGFTPLTAAEYDSACRKLRPDIVLALPDLVYLPKIGKKRLGKSADRTHGWLRDVTTALKLNGLDKDINLFAHILPLDEEKQSFYLYDLSEEYKSQISGFALSTAESVEVIPADLNDKPRLLLGELRSPADILDAVGHGVDVLTFSFVNEASDAGLAFTFAFGEAAPSHNSDNPLPLAIDLWSEEHAVDVSPLTADCSCYTCGRHHRAYLNHLLNAKEMLAWTLLQVHNHSMMDNFFASVRTSIESGTFEEDVKVFNEQYQADFPPASGQGPYARGYQYKSVGGGEPRKNKKAYGHLDDQLEKLAEAESGVPVPTEGSKQLEESGFAQKTDTLDGR